MKDKIENYAMHKRRRNARCSFCKNGSTPYSIHSKLNFNAGNHGYICGHCFEERFGIPLLDGWKQEKYSDIVNCSECGEERMCILRVDPRKHDSVLHWFCEECYEKLSE